jgi:hypothetical protein
VWGSGLRASGRCRPGYSSVSQSLSIHSSGSTDFGRIDRMRYKSETLEWKRARARQISEPKYNILRKDRDRGRATLDTTQGQIDGFFSQLPYKCHQDWVASVGDWLEIGPWVASSVGAGRTLPRWSSPGVLLRDVGGIRHPTPYPLPPTPYPLPPTPYPLSPIPYSPTP